MIIGKKPNTAYENIRLCTFIIIILLYNYINICIQLYLIIYIHLFLNIHHKINTYHIFHGEPTIFVYLKSISSMLHRKIIAKASSTQT